MRFFSTYLIPALCLIVAWVGAYIQGNDTDTIALARAGAVIVCLGMLRAFLDLTTTFKEIDSDMASGEFPRSIVDMTESLDPPGNAAKARAEHKRLSLSSGTARIDLAILILGTLLWGFGDILPVPDN